MRRIADALLLALIIGLGAVLRFGGLSVPSLWLDEILDFDVATSLTHEPLWHWLTGFASEHGPLFFATELAGRLAHAPELAARVAPAVFGVAAVLVAAFAVRVAHRNTATSDALVGPESMVFALLLAGSPLAVYYSREARPYALLLLLATAMLAMLLRAGGHAPFAFALPILALFTTSGSAPLLLATAVTAAGAFLISRKRFFAGFAAVTLLAVALMPLLYRRMPASAPTGFRPLSARLF